ncbi:MAG: efflux RND transporter periplasmic adaptor subunit [Isosphaeraceae bacterium]|nr:efflux RND transporter periplasmic adaptor subunit [Isosphaeraceae bacterium]
MHNHPDRGRFLQVLAGSLIASLPLAGGCGTGQAERQARREPQKVKVVEVKKSTTPILAFSNGTTRAIEEVIIRARVKGFLEEKHFEEGAMVKVGQLLLVIDEEPFQVRLAQAEAGLGEAEANLRKAEQSKSVEIARAQLALDQASAFLAQVEVNRERSLYARKATPLEEVDRREAQAKRSVAQVDAAKAALEQAITDHDVNIAAAKAVVEKAKADVRNARIELGYCRMTAPISGRIGELRVKLGNLVGPDADSELVDIRRLDPMGFDVRPSSRYLERINRVVAAGTPVGFKVEGERDYGHRGKVVFIDNKIDPATSTVLLKAEVPNPNNELLPGEYIRTRTVVGEYANAITIPERALMESQSGFSVFVVNGEGRVERKNVTLTDTIEGVAVIEEGLSEGQRVIVDGLQLVRQEDQVEVENVEAEEARIETTSPASRPPSTPSSNPAK